MRQTQNDNPALWKHITEVHGFNAKSTVAELEVLHLMVHNNKDLFPTEHTWPHEIED